MRFQDQIVVVTGASRGIGKGIAHAFANEGATVVCTATTASGADAVAQSIIDAGGKAVGMALNVGDADDVAAFCDRLVDAVGTPSVLVNNAGIAVDALMMRMKDDDWDRVIDVNLKGAFLLIRGLSRPMMKARYGRIVNISSVVGLHGAAGQTNYAAAKAGLLGLTKAVAKELGSRNITCNAVAPGFIQTDMTTDLPETFKEHVATNAPAGRLGTPEDVAPAVLFLASREAGYITGETLSVDGGLFL
mgnify:CR=1 FL=1